MLCSSELVIVRERKCTIQNSYFQTSFGVGVVSPCIFNLETSNGASRTSSFDLEVLKMKARAC